jgi:hypothetical protein
MSKVFRIVILLVFPFSVIAQNADSLKWKNFGVLYDQPFNKVQPQQIVSLSSSQELFTSKISNDFVYPFLKGDNLDRSTINRTIDRSGSKWVGVMQQTELSWINLKKGIGSKKKLHLYLKAGNYAKTFAELSDDAMRLVFEGNTGMSQYEIGNCRYTNIGYNKIGGGVFINKDKARQPWNLSVGVFLIQSTAYGRITTSADDVYTGNEDSFKIKTNYSAWFSSSKAFSSTGYGGALEVNFNQRLDASSAWGISVTDLGFVNFNNVLTQYSSNGTFNFKGVFIPEVSRLGETYYFQNQFDSITSPLVNEKRNLSGYLLVSPKTRVYLCKRFGSHYLQVSLNGYGVRAKSNFELRYFRFIKSSWLWGMSIGGLGNTYLNTDIQKVIANKWYLKAGLYHIEALVLPKMFGGLGGHAGISYSF